LPDDVKKVIDETTGLVMSQDAGRVYDNVRPIMKGFCIKQGMEALKLDPGQREKLAEAVKPLRAEWVNDMNAKGLPGKAVLEAAVKLSK
jgi:TRAP-type C4-dicarboxylate transport system substrate-binding protein